MVNNRVSLLWELKLNPLTRTQFCSGPSLDRRSDRSSALGLRTWSLVCSAGVLEYTGTWRILGLSK